VKYYPVLLDLKGLACLVVGGGAVAERKLNSLAETGAALTVVSPSLSPGLQSLSAADVFVHKCKTFEDRDLDGAFLVIAATDDHAVNEAIAAQCRKRGVLVNAATSPAASTFIVPSVVEQGGLLIAVSTCGASPALARRVREQLEREFGPEYAALLDVLGRLRKGLPDRVPDEATRRRIYETVVGSDILALLRQGDGDGAEEMIRKIVEREISRPAGPR
jgi:precorrin-2 dehydrogenase/sirohydrochlorin ferrochelatase